MTGDHVSTGRDAAGVESGTVPTNGIDTYYQRRGSGPPVVFIHGFFMDSRLWEPQLAALADEYTVVAYDLRGHGRTGGSAASSYSASLFASDLDALLDALDLDRPVLCGLSMGGMVAQVYAARHPAKVAGLVLADTFTPGALPVGGGLAMPHLALFALSSHVVSPERLNAFQLWVGERVSPGLVGSGETVQRLVETGPPMSGAEFRKGIGSILAFMRSEFDPSTIAVPTLVLYGEHEPAPIRKMAEHLAAQIDHGSVELSAIPGAGHASNLDAPAAFTDAVRRLVARAG